MNRRSFFSSLAAFAGAASLSPNIFIPKFEPVKWKVRTWRRNPGWFVAQYKCFIDMPPGYGQMIFHRRETELLVPDTKSLITVERNGVDAGTWTWDKA